MALVAWQEILVPLAGMVAIWVREMAALHGSRIGVRWGADSGAQGKAGDGKMSCPGSGIALAPWT